MTDSILATLFGAGTIAAGAAVVAAHRPKKTRLPCALKELPQSPIPPQHATYLVDVFDQCLKEHLDRESRAEERRQVLHRRKREMTLSMFDAFKHLLSKRAIIYARHPVMLPRTLTEQTTGFHIIGFHIEATGETPETVAIRLRLNNHEYGGGNYKWEEAYEAIIRVMVQNAVVTPRQQPTANGMFVSGRGDQPYSPLDILQPGTMIPMKQIKEWKAESDGLFSFYHYHKQYKAIQGEYLLNSGDGVYLCEPT